MSLYHHQHPGDPQGYSHGNSASSALGRPSLTQWELFVRESLQNSWDARDRKDSEDGVTYAIEYRDLSTEASEYLRNEIFSPTVKQPRGLASAIKKEHVPLLVVSDTGTYGLRGPTNAATSVDGPTDYSSFVLEVGRSQDKEVRGGSYGFGKGVFYKASSAETIIVYSRTHDERGQRAHRLICTASSDSFSEDGERYTGRHWWGKKATYHRKKDAHSTIYTEPLTGQEADNVARILGLDQHFSEQQPTGTTIAVVDPIFATSNTTESPLDACKQMARALTRWAWPHMIYKEPSDDALVFKVTINGEDVPIPDPKEDPVLSAYADAYLKLLRHDTQARQGFKEMPGNVSVSTVTAGNQHRLTGMLALKELTTSGLKQDGELNIPLNAVALLRSPRFIVEYRELSITGDIANYAGVFVADKGVDREFAKSEPTAHDGWNAMNMEPGDVNPSWGRINPVRVSLDRIRKLLQAWASPFSKSDDGKYDRATRRISEQLGTLFTGIDGTGLSRKVTSKSGKRVSVTTRKRKDKYKIKLVSMEASGGIVTAKYQVSFPNTKGLKQVRMQVLPVSENGTFDTWDDLEYFAEISSISYFSAVDEDLVSPLRSIELERDTTDFREKLEVGRDKIVVFVRHDPLVAVGLKLTQEDES